MKRGLAIFAALSAACASGAPAPAPLDTKNESCAWCRMTVSEARFAGQVAAPSEEPKFFDDIGCLAHYLAGARALPRGAVSYVTDHRTRDWVKADAALYTRVDSLATPMGSHLIAHADAASRDADPAARGGTPRTPAEVFGGGSVRGGGR